MSLREIPVKFKPRARLLLQLGDQLIKNESIALVELVKNSYDADANKVEIYMEHVDSAEEGVIIIEDDGYGMDLNTVENVWMEPGSDFKAEKFKNRETSPNFKRLPIGEKGIGRFGVHKLGNQIEMTTKKSGEKEVFVKIDWLTFNKYKYLADVPINIIERDSPQLFKNGKTGTSITISKLRKEWSRGVARNVKRTITALVSPFDSNDSFQAQFDIADKPGWFEGLLNWEDVKDFSMFHFNVKLNGNSITEFRYEFLPWSSMPKLSSRIVDTSSELVANFSSLEDVNGKNVNLNDYDIGEVRFEGYIFDRDPYILKFGVADKKGFKDYLASNSGIRVFRDGLRIYDYGEPENDWLGLDIRRVNEPAKRLSNNLILGAVYLQRDKSFDLIEKTNREGFVENNAYEAFRSAILHTLNIIEIHRFSDKQKLRTIYGPTRRSEPVLSVLGDLKDYIDKNVSSVEIKKEITRQLVKIEDDYKRINETLLKAAGAGLSMSVVIHEVEKIILEVVKVLKSEKASSRAIGLVNHLSSLIDGYSEIIRKSTQTNEDLKEVINQALFNTEFRLMSHKIEVNKAYLSYKGQSKTKIARSLLIGTLMNVIDNSIFWLERSGTPNKKLYIQISEEEEGFINIIVADNGTGFLIPTDEITEPFVSGKPGGMGLGLHIANEIMIAQKGKLSFPDLGDFELPDEFKSGAVIAFSFKK
jgi:signal transduction histidine kinase